MKRFYFLLISCALLLTGCSNDTPVMPESNTMEKTWINIKGSAGSSIENSIFSSARINGNQGGELILQGSYQSNSNRVVYFESYLQVPANAFSGSRFLTEEAGEGTFVDFGPTMIFNVPLKLDLSFSGLDLSGLDANQINFYYMANDGTFVLTENEGIYVDIASGTLKVYKAKLNHFSRYGWAK